MKNTKRVISLVLSLILAFSVLSTTAAAAPADDKIYLPTGTDPAHAAEFAVGETIFGEAKLGESFVYYVFNDSVKDVTLKYRATALTSFKVENALNETVFADKLSTLATNRTIKLPAGGFYVTIANAETTDITTKYSFAVCPENYENIYARMVPDKVEELNSGETKQLKLEDLTKIDGLNCFWRILDDPKTAVDESKFAEISKDGLVKINYPTNINKFAEATYIKAQAVFYYGYEKYGEELTKTCEILAIPANIYLDPNYTVDEPCFLAKGITRQINATTNAASPSASSKKAKLIWESSNPSVATVDTKGRITSHDYGETIITVSIDEVMPKISRSFKVKVDPDWVSVKGIDFDKTSVSIRLSNFFPDKTYALTHTFETFPADKTPSEKGVTYTSSNVAVATVDKHGNVKPISKGTATITIKSVDGGYTDTCEVTVTEKPNIIVEMILLVVEFVVGIFQKGADAIRSIFKK